MTCTLCDYHNYVYNLHTYCPHLKSIQSCSMQTVYNITWIFVSSSETILCLIAGH